MIIDLNNSAPNSVSIKKYDVCIVGGGTAGIYLAKALSNKNLNVSLLEVGNLEPKKVDFFLKPPNLLNTKYRGAHLGRMAGLGGTSVKWGGQMIALSESDFKTLNTSKKEYYWPINFDELVEYYRIVSKKLKIFNFSENNKEFKSLSNLTEETSFSNFFNFRQSVWIPFRKRNFYKGNKSELIKSHNIDVWINSNFNGFKSAIWEKDNLKSISFSGHRNQKLIINSKIFILTAGAIETTRHLLMLKNLKLKTQQQSMPFCDHVSVSVGELKLKQPKRFSSLFSPYFKNGSMRSFRFEINKSNKHEIMPASAFVHFIVEQKKGSAFDFIRSFVRKLQGEKNAFTISKTSWSKFFIEITRLFYWRIVRKRLYINHNEKILMVVDIEQLPNEDNKIIINDRGDINIEWSVGENDKLFAKYVAEQFKNAWDNTKSLSCISQIELFSEKIMTEANFYDVFHPTGSIPMGFTKDSSILDKNLKVWNTSNLYASSTAVFPTAGSANPGFTHLALTERLTEHILVQIEKNIDIF
jgi:hypothetical protein